MLIAIMKRDEYKWVYTNIKVWMKLRVDLNEKYLYVPVQFKVYTGYCGGIF